MYCMKKLFYIVMLFFTLALSLLLGSDTLHNQSFESINYFQNIEKESVVLVSNNLFNGEISSYQQKKEQNYSGSTPVILLSQTIDSLFNKNKSHLIGCFIHNLSANNQEIHPIRAP